MADAYFLLELLIIALDTLGPPLMSIAFYAARRRAISRCSFPRNTRWS